MSKNTIWITIGILILVLGFCCISVPRNDPNKEKPKQTESSDQLRDGSGFRIDTTEQDGQCRRAFGEEYKFVDYVPNGFLSEVIMCGNGKGDTKKIN